MNAYAIHFALKHLALIPITVNWHGDHNVPVKPYEHDENALELFCILKIEVFGKGHHLDWLHQAWAHIVTNSLKPASQIWKTASYIQ